MPLNIGGAAASKVYCGATPATAVYLGSTKVWPPNMVPWTDTFNRANGGMGSNWTIGINGNYPAQIWGNKGVVNPNIGSNISRYAYWNFVNTQAGWPKTDSYKMTAQLTTPLDSLASNNWVGIVFGWDGVVGSTQPWIMFMGSTGSGSKIVVGTNSAASANGNQLPDASGATILGTGANIMQTDLIVFSKTGSLFTAYRNGKWLCDAPWSGLPDGSNRRRPGIFIEGNHPLFQAVYSAPSIDSLTIEDL